jgi:hypothetical protein
MTALRGGSKMYRMRISLRPAEPGRSSFRLLSRVWVDAVGERAA